MLGAALTIRSRDRRPLPTRVARPGRGLTAQMIMALLVVLQSAAGAETTSPAVESFPSRDFFLAPVRVHLWMSRHEPDLCTTLTESDVARVLTKVNRVWAPAGICFYLEGLVREEPRDRVPSQRGSTLATRVRPETHSAKSLHVYYIKNFRPNGICF